MIPAVTLFITLNNSYMIPAVTLFITFTMSAVRQSPLVYMVVKITQQFSPLQIQVVKEDG